MISQTPRPADLLLNMSERLMAQMPKVDDLQASIEQQEVSGSFTRAELWPYKNLTILKRLTFSLLQIKFLQTN